MQTRSIYPSGPSFLPFQPRSSSQSYIKAVSAPN